ncbi:corrinoid ABC transporter substrate-binding protein [Halobacteriales archaeon SW_8_65_20]|nr:MAG: corrinoid ABC transporter substrate-binding protein [Halobacteriales archaeon SW_8_65_20]
MTLTDASGTEVTVEERPDRVTTLNPSAAQTMWEIGGKSQVVGVTDFAGYLDGAEERTSVSKTDGVGFSVERVVGTEPDLVLAPNTTTTDQVAALRDAGLTVYLFAAATDTDDIAQKTTTIGKLTGNCDGAARTNAWMTANVDAAVSATADRESPRVLNPLGSGYVANTNTFISAMITASGGQNALADANVTDTLYPQVSDEVILETNPEVLVVSSRLDDIQNEEPYQSTIAGQNNATVTVNTSYLNEPAPRSVVYSVRNLTEAFHPDAEASFVAKSEVTVSTATATPTESTPADTATTEPSTTGEQPGFGVAALVLAVGAIVLARRE